jgi:multidrug efflux pump subunit AcrA (membrane-fusion protein)
VEGAGIEEPGAESLADTGGGVRATAPVLREDSLAEREELLRERAQLLARVHRLEAELDRHRARSERTSKLLLSATGYAEWVRERARRDAEVALRKATARAQKLVQTTRDLEETQNELVRLKDELTRLRSLTDETRARLSAFLTAGLQAINAEMVPASANGPDPAPGHLDDTLRRQLPSALFTVQRQTPPMSGPESVTLGDAEPHLEP